MEVKLSYINGHVEVFDGAGQFLFSADSHREAMEEVERGLTLTAAAKENLAA